MKTEATTTQSPSVAAERTASGEPSSSRRNFLHCAVAGLTIAGAGSAMGFPQTAPSPQSRPLDPIEEVLRRYGSEFGPVTRVG